MPLHRWVNHTFRDRGGIKVCERYSRPLQPQEDVLVTLSSAFGGDGDGASTNLLLIPSALFLRKYLRLLEELLDVTQSSGNNARGFALIICESAAELGDYRNSSLPAEAAAPNERSRVMRLVEQNRGTAIPFADLSCVGVDEMDTLTLELATVEDRARIALCEAGLVLRNAAAATFRPSESAKYQTNVHLLVCEDESINTPSIETHSSSEMIDHLFRSNILSRDQMDSLLDLAARCEEEYNKRNAGKDAVVSRTTGGGGRVPYLGQTQVEDGLKNCAYYRGKLEVTKANNREAYVTVSISGGRKEKYYIDDQNGNFNRALHGDDVIIEPLDETLWGSPVGRRRLVHVQNNSEVEEDGVGKDSTLGPTVPSAKVVALYIPKGGNVRRRQYVATVQIESHRRLDDSAVLAVPMDTRIPKIRIKSRMGSERIAKKRLLVEVDAWDVGSGFPSGHISKIIGPVGDMETEIECLLIEHEIYLPPFSASALACLPEISSGSEWQIPASETSKRRDLRKSHRIFSVDPPGCQDIDDTMSACVLPNGDFEVGVHIADVTHFVQHESRLDLEARSRGTTFYLVDRRFDMLPPLLSSDLCSLHGNVDRLAVSVIWTLSPDLEEVKSCWYGRTVIHNCAAMTYDQADAILQGASPDDPAVPPPPALTAGSPVDVTLIPNLKKDLTILTKLARKLREKREDIGGAVDLSSGERGSELKFVLDSNGSPVRVAAKTEKEIHHTIAEMMIFANSCVASRIHESFPETALLRIHRSVEEGRFEELESTLKVAGIDFDGRSNKGLANTLKASKLGGKYGAIVDSLLQSLATRAMSEAQYICSGAFEGDSGLSHYGLGIDMYTHFTSPIRRYADVVVHRELLAAIASDSSPRSTRQLDGLKVERSELETLPDSTVKSVLGQAEEEDELDGDDLLDSLIEGASELALPVDTTKKSSLSPSATAPKHNDEEDGTSLARGINLFDKSQVIKICDRINHMNRVAKLSSMDCQRLFLSLYFRANVETTSAVVLSLRTNGLIVYIPQFDMKGPVFLSDRDGQLQIDPANIGLPPDAGLSPSPGFSALENCRLLPDGTCELDGDRLIVGVEGGARSTTFRSLDVIMVQLSSDIFDTSARIPPPRIHLVSEEQKGENIISSHGKNSRKSNEKILMSTNLFQSKDTTAQPITDNMSRGNTIEETVERPSMFHVLSSIKIESNLTTGRFGAKTRSTTARKSSFPGRIVVGEFSNPDTHQAEQAAAAKAASEAAAQRRTLHSQTAEGSYDAAKKIEREATARMQRRAAEKRNRRKAG